MIAVILIAAMMYGFVRLIIWLVQDAQRQALRAAGEGASAMSPAHPARAARRVRRGATPADDLIGATVEVPRWTALDDHQLTRLLSDAAAR